MTEQERDSMPKEAREMYDSIAAIMKLSRWAYEFASENGFTPNQSLEMSKNYMACVMGAFRERVSRYG